MRYREVTDAAVINYLVIDCGFSGYNAEIAIRMYKDDELADYKHIFDKIYKYTPEDQEITYWYPVSSALNYKITIEYGGRATGRKSK